MDWRSGDFAEGRGDAAVVACRRRAAQACDLAGQGDLGAGAGDSAVEGWAEESGAADWELPVPWAYRRGQDGDGADAGGVFVRQREGTDPIRHVGVHGEAFGEQVDRFASGICRI